MNGAASNGVLLTGDHQIYESNYNDAILRGHAAAIEQPTECEELRLSTDQDTLAICAQGATAIIIVW